MADEDAGLDDFRPSAVEEAMKRILSGESEAETIEGVGDGGLHLSRDVQEPGVVRMRGAVEGVEFDGVGFRRSDARPPSYPSHVLFLSDTPSFIMSMADDQGVRGYMVIWMDIRDAEESAGKLEQLCMSGGWTKMDSDSIPEPFRIGSSEQSVFVKDNAMRVASPVIGTDGEASLMLLELELTEEVAA